MHSWIPPSRNVVTFYRFIWPFYLLVSFDVNCFLFSCLTIYRYCPNKHFLTYWRVFSAFFRCCYSFSVVKILQIIFHIHTNIPKIVLFYNINYLNSCPRYFLLKIGILSVMGIRKSFQIWFIFEVKVENTVRQA